MVGFEKVTLWPLVALMFIIGIYPTIVLRYFNGFALSLIEFVKGLS